ncbi:hypothetical protein GOP47_0009887 [Adiantum capillus-veneris]|uniref:CHCH domain-containing protein n=1 Tax=Adiantum capillus-veneris TaxID=13818 RepID=A0A9D4UXF8_ADICA|nr:hypothetical protein GOP47_0009324 [Adiantum capillus-veneris]KAI5075811.1 hypothetical protein GOP47_0009887 [Adiantum capillus-veneris]
MASEEGAAVAPYVPVTTSAVLMSASKHLSHYCREENRAFVICKRADSDPEKCIHRGLEVTRCTLSLLKRLHEKCPKEMDAFAKCMDYYGNEFKLCRKQQQEFESACPLKV